MNKLYKGYHSNTEQRNYYKGVVMLISWSLIPTQVIH